MATHGRRRAPVPRHEAQAGGGQHAERALAARQQGRQVEADGLLRQPGQRADRRTVGEDGLGRRRPATASCRSGRRGSHRRWWRRRPPIGGRVAAGEVDRGVEAGLAGVVPPAGQRDAGRRRHLHRSGVDRPEVDRAAASTARPSARHAGRCRRPGRCCRPGAPVPPGVGADPHHLGHLAVVGRAARRGGPRRGSGPSSPPRTSAVTSGSVRTWSAPTTSASAAASGSSALTVTVRPEQQGLQRPPDLTLVVEQDGVGQPDAGRVPVRRHPAAHPLADGVAVQRDRRGRCS